MSKFIGTLFLVALLAGCGGPDIKGTYTAEKTVFLMTAKFSIEFKDEGKAIISMPNFNPRKKGPEQGELQYTYEDNMVSLSEEGKPDQILLKVEEEGKILRLVGGAKGMPEVWTRQLEVKS